MLLSGPLAFHILAAQVLDWVGGEWWGFCGKPIVKMFIALAVLVSAATLMAYASTLG